MHCAVDPTRFPVKENLSDHHATICDLIFPADFPKDHPLVYRQKRKADCPPKRSLDSTAIKLDKQEWPLLYLRNLTTKSSNSIRN